MPLKSPTFDSRTYQQILQEALARVPAHNPEWSNFNDSDPGVTLLQLFAFMSESIIYRTNLIPERNRMKFLKLLDIGMRPASTAQGLVQFNSKTHQVLARDQEILAGNVPFRTEKGLGVLPIQSKLFYKQKVTDTQLTNELTTLYNELYQAIEENPENLQLYETRIFSAPESGSLLPILKLNETVDASYWLALLADEKSTPELARKQIANKPLTLGIMPALSEDGCVLYPLGPAASTEQPSLIFEIPKVDPANLSAQYQQLRVVTEHDPLAYPGTIELILPEELKYWDNLEPLTSGTGNYPPSLENTDDAARLISWIRIRSSEIIVDSPENQQSSYQQTTAINWIGVNAAVVRQKARVNTEQLARGTGQPDQILILRNTPIIPESLQLRINGQLWQAIDDLNAAAPEVPKRSPRLASGNKQGDDIEQINLFNAAQVYKLDPESGEIYFGNGIQGSRPALGASIIASYDYGGGTQGNVGIGELNKQSGLQGLKVNNPVPTWGADDQESLEQAERRIPAQLRHNERLVSAQDYRDITLATPGVDLGRVEVLPLFNPNDIDLNSEGMVTMMVIPLNDPNQPEAPVPDRLFLQNICDFLAPRRIITTELYIRGPDYQDIIVSVGIEVIPGRAQSPIVNTVKLAIQDFLSPLTGGFNAFGWPLNSAVEAAELAAAVTRVDGVASVQNRLLLGDNNANPASPMPMIGLQLPRLAGVSVTVGDPLPLEDILGLSSEVSGTGTAGIRTPVPIIQEVC